MANKKFGTLVTENMGGYTWYKNSRLNRVTSWENQPNYDIPSEIIYLKDQETKNKNGLTLVIVLFTVLIVAVVVIPFIFNYLNN